MSNTPNPIQVQKYLAGIDYPASKDDIVQAAQKNGADDTVLGALRNLPDKTFDAPTEVSEAISDE